VPNNESKSQGVALGLDFGTESVRALLVDLRGGERGMAVARYRHGQLTETLPGTGEKLPADFALQHPQDWPDSAARAVRFLVDNLGPDGVWSESVEYSWIPHVYNSRVAWAMLRWAGATADDGARHAAERHLEWVLGRQRPNGWFDDCVFKPGTEPSTHGLAYTLRGLLESHALTGESRYLDAVLCTSEVLIRKLEVLGYLPANFDEDWRPAARHACLTGTVQLGGVWLRLFQIGGDDRYLNAGLKAIDLAAGRQERGPWRATRGALAGSFPVWGRYAPLQYPNWAAKFLADALMLRDDCLAA